jgi:hypothetical protein
VDSSLFEKLHEQQLISEAEYENIQQHRQQPVSVYWDITALLYTGVLLFTTGLGILVYKNIDSIGHAVIITLIAVVCMACFVYCLKKAKGYSPEKVESPDVLFDYVLLLGCLLLLIFTGYIQFAYNVFGNHWGQATFIPMVILFIAAYYFDHVGVLSLAITNLAAWTGITVAPLQVLHENDFGDERLIYAGLMLGAGLVAISFVSVYKSIKEHFAFTYKNFGAHLLFIWLLAAMFHYDRIYLLWFVALAAAGLFFYRSALKERSYYFLVITALYVYVGICYVVVNVLEGMGGDIGVVYIGFIYFIVSGIVLIRILIHFNKTLKHAAGL